MLLRNIFPLPVGAAVHTAWEISWEKVVMMAVVVMKFMEIHHSRVITKRVISLGS